MLLLLGSTIPRARSDEVLEAGDHGGGHLVRPQRGALPLTGQAVSRYVFSPSVRHLVSQ